MQIKYYILSLLILLICSCSKSEHTADYNEPSEWEIVKVAVILPISGNDSYKTRYDRVVEMFEENVIKSQLNEQKGIKLELEWYDENTIDINNLANELRYEREDIKAVIGPTRDDNIKTIADYLYSINKPIFVTTSSETIIREFSSGGAGVNIKEPFLWSISESDVTLIELIFYKMYTMEIDDVSLLYINNDYGETFNKWAPTIAHNTNMNMKGKESYSGPEELATKIDLLLKSDTEYVICALESSEDAKTVLQAKKNYPDGPKVLFTGSVFTSDLMPLGEIAEGAEGLSIAPSPNTGFEYAYRDKYNELPMPYEAQMYDALLLSLISAAYCHYNGNNLSMNEVIAKLSDLPLPPDNFLPDDYQFGKGTPVWNYSGLKSIVLDNIREGRLPQYNIIGATCNLKFLDESYTALNYSVYINWKIEESRPIALDYLTSKGMRAANYYTSWLIKKITRDPFVFREDIENNYAVLICGSQEWGNYRHQADILNVYNLLKKYGFEDDDIILIMSDDIAYNPRNPYPGVIKTSPDGNNLYKDFELDYKADTLSTNDIADILLGNKSERLSVVLESGKYDNVLLYWTGHGSKGKFSWLKDGAFTKSELTETVQQMYNNNRFYRMMIVAEPCKSSSVVDETGNIPYVITLASASEDENSYAENYNVELGTCMSDRFTGNLVHYLNINPYTSYSKLYNKLVSSTLASNVNIFYNKDYINLNSYGPYEFFMNNKLY